MVVPDLSAVVMSGPRREAPWPGTMAHGSWLMVQKPAMHGTAQSSLGSVGQLDKSRSHLKPSCRVDQAQSWTRRRAPFVLNGEASAMKPAALGILRAVVREVAAVV